MNKFVKKIMIGLTSVTITFSSFSSVLAMPLLLHEDKSIKNLSSGVVHEHIKQFHANGWWNINVLRVNLNDQHTNIGTLFSNKGISQRDTLTNMMKDTKSIGAVNADFFSMSNPSFSLGPTVSDGKIVSSPKFNEGKGITPVFSIDNAKNPSISYWDWNINVVAENGNTLPVITINKDSGSQHHAIVFNDSWGGLSHNGKSSDVVDLVVQNGVVTEVRVGQPPIYVPSQGYVVSGKGPAKEFLLNNFAVGSKLDFQTSGNVNFDSITAAVGGGSWLLKDGVKTGFDMNVTGNRSRTAVGITQDRKQLIMMTIDQDSRNKVFGGVSQEIVADIMKHLGAYDAINFDGGGSTTMAVKEREDTGIKLVNIPSEGNQRRISNALGVFDSAPMGNLKYLELSTEDTNMFANTSRSFSIKGYDEFYHPMNVNINDVKFSVEGVSGTFVGNKLTANNAGMGKVKAELNGATGEISINVLDNIKEIKTDFDKIGIGASASIPLGNIYGIDSKGVKSNFNPSDINWEVIGDVGSVKDGVFYASSESKSGAIVAKLGGAVKTILVSVGLDSKPLNDLETIDGLGISSYPNNLVTGKIGLNSDSKVGNSSIQIDYDFSKTDQTRAFYTSFGQGFVLNGEPSGLGLWINGNSDGTWVRGDLVDSTGKAFKVDFAKSVDWNGWKSVNANIPSGVKYPVTLKTIYVAQTNANNKSINHILIDGLSGLYAKDLNDSDKSNLPTSTQFVDEYNKKAELVDGGYKFLAGFVSNTAPFRNILADNRHAFLIGGLDPNISNGLNTSIVSLDNGFEVKNDKDTAFIKVNNTNGGIRASNSEQWLWLKSALSNANEKNIVLLLPRSVYSFNDKMEEELFHNIIKEYKSKGKNMYIVYGSNKTGIELKDGVKYFEINLNQSGTYIQFAVNNGDITYQVLPIQ